MRNPLAHRRIFRRANALIEMALVMPILIMLTLGGVEYGYAFYLKNTLQGAAREAARVGIAPSATAAEVKTAANHVVSNAIPGLTGKGTYKVTVDPADPSANGVVWVTVTVECQWKDSGVSALPSSMGGITPSRILKSTAVMKKE